MDQEQRERMERDLLDRNNKSGKNPRLHAQQGASPEPSHP